MLIASSIHPGFYGGLGLRTYEDGSLDGDRGVLAKELYPGAERLIPTSHREIVSGKRVDLLTPFAFKHKDLDGNTRSFYVKGGSDHPVISVCLSIHSTMRDELPSDSPLIEQRDVAIAHSRDIAYWAAVESRMDQLIEHFDRVIEGSECVYRQLQSGSPWDVSIYGFQRCKDEDSAMIEDETGQKFFWQWLDWWQSRRLIAVKVPS
jgi:hypothetical protein